MLDNLLMTVRASGKRGHYFTVAGYSSTQYLNVSTYIPSDQHYVEEATERRNEAQNMDKDFVFHEQAGVDFPWLTKSGQRASYHGPAFTVTVCDGRLD